MKIAVLELPSGQRRQSAPFRCSFTLDIPCPCGGWIHPFIGAWCVRCRAQIVEIVEVRAA